MECQHLVTFWGVSPAAATGYNPCPGSRPLANHVPRGCTNPFPTLILMIMVITMVMTVVITMVITMVVTVRPTVRPSERPSIRPAVCPSGVVYYK